MSNTTEHPAREIYLLENVPIQGRKTELRQLLKLLNLAKTGQPKAALITGDAGMGKTTLLETFTQLVQEGVYCRVLHLGKMDMASPEVVYVRLIEKLQAEADSILDDALVAVNEITKDLELHWDRNDLTRAIALVKLQESIGGKEALSQEQLVKAIRSQVPAVKKLKFSVNESIQKLVDLIVNPWVMVATSLLNPMSQPLQEAMQLAETLRENNFVLPQEHKLNNLLHQAEARPMPIPVDEAPPLVLEVKPEALPVQREPLPPVQDVEDLEEEIQSRPKPVKKLPLLVDPELNYIFEENARNTGQDFLLNELPIPVSTKQPSRSSSQSPASQPTAKSTTHMEVSLEESGSTTYTPARLDTPPRPIKDPLLRRLMTVFNFINHSIQQIDTGLLVMLDEWERCLDLPRLNDLKEFFSELVLQITEQKNYHFMLVMTARAEGESYTLGGSLYNQFRTKMLLDVLPENACRKLVRNMFRDSNTEVDEEIHQQLYRLSRGNPFWHIKMSQYMKERAESNRTRLVDMDFFDKLGLDRDQPLHNLFELSFTRLKLAFLNDEDALCKVIAALLKHFGEAPFSANMAILEIGTSQGLSDAYVFEVLRALFHHDFIRLLGESPAEARMLQAARETLETTSGGLASGPQSDPLYLVQSRFILDFLYEKTRRIETDISTDEKIMYLKKIIPLSVKSGDLDREKTREVLALGDAMGNTELVIFLEEVFIDAMQDPRAVVRVTALNNIALIDTPGSRDVLFTALQDDDAMVREYAARNLAQLAEKAHDPKLANRVIDLMLEAIDDDSDAVRAQIYATLTRYRTHRELTSVFIKGASDACDGVRLTSIRNLTELEIQTPYVFQCLMGALDDKLPEIRRAACMGLQNYNSVDAIEAIAKLLQNDSDTGLRSLAADSLSNMEDEKAFLALVDALRREASEDVKLAVVRALGKRRGWQTEAVLQEAMLQADFENMPVFTWACIRSLGQVGGTERSQNILMELRKKLSNGIILSALDVAVKRIADRHADLRHMERQLEEATPITVVTPTEDEREVALPEEEVLEVSPIGEQEHVDISMQKFSPEFEPSPQSHEPRTAEETGLDAEFVGSASGLRLPGMPRQKAPRPENQPGVRGKSGVKLPFLER